MLLYATIKTLKKIKKWNSENYSLMDLASSAPFSNASAKTSSSGTNRTSKVSVTVKPAVSNSSGVF